MFSFFKKKPSPSPAQPQDAPAAADVSPTSAAVPAVPAPSAPAHVPATAAAPAPGAVAPVEPAASTGVPGAPFGWLRNPFGAKTPDAPPPTRPAEPVPAPVTAAPPARTPNAAPAAFAPAPATSQPVVQGEVGPASPEERKGWLDRLTTGLRKTGTSITTVFTGTRIDDALYEELEEALLMADTGVKATTHLLADLKRRVKDSKTTEPAAVKNLLADALADLLRPLEKALVIGEHTPTVIMVAGLIGCG